MIIHTFDSETGVYHFETADLATGLHSHPPLEIVLALDGSFSISLPTGEIPDLRFAVIGPNQIHSLRAENGQVSILMVEHHVELVLKKLRLPDRVLETGYFTSLSMDACILADLKWSILRSGPFTRYEPRVQWVVDYLRDHFIDYGSMMELFKNQTCLSESRLSHLFRQEMGISLKKYRIWTQLRAAVAQHLHENTDLFSALIQRGFYDQPHFSRTYKRMLGIKPSFAYNSRTVQVGREGRS